MQIGLMIIEFLLEGCSSLKEKRQRMSGLRDRFGCKANIAVCETNFQNSHRRAEWSFISIANDNNSLDQTLINIENQIESRVDALIINIQREKL